jgi:hypothetical protein
MRIGPDHITPTTTVRNLGICLDSSLTMQYHVQRIVATWFAVLHQLRSVRRSTPAYIAQPARISDTCCRIDAVNTTLWQHGADRSSSLNTDDRVGDRMVSVHNGKIKSF